MWFHVKVSGVVPHLDVGLLDFKLNSSPRPELFSSPGLLLAHPWSGVPNPRVSLECPTPEYPLPREGGDVRSKIIVLILSAYVVPWALVGRPSGAVAGYPSCGGAHSGLVSLCSAAQDA